MAGKTPAEAVQNFIDPLQMAISCVTKAVFNVRGGYYASAEPHPVTLGDGDPVRLSGNPALFLSVLQNYRLVEYEGPRGPWKVIIVSYYYSLEDQEGHEIAYHWHPQTASALTHPHVHLAVGAQFSGIGLNKTHFPTGRIALEDVLRLAITELGIRPLRNNWEEVLDSTQAAHEAWRT